MPLVLWLLRHGEAGPPGDGGDATRMLSPRGERTIAELAATLAGEGWRPVRAFASPLQRAIDTARLLLARVAPGLEPEPLGELIPEADPLDVISALNARDALRGDVLLVSHQPLLGLLGSRLAGAEPGFPPGALVGIAFDGPPRAGAGRIVRALRPREP